MVLGRERTSRPRQRGLCSGWPRGVVAPVACTGGSLMPQKTIITCAVTGSLTKPEMHPGLPITPQQIADSALEAATAGAAIVHIHVRNPQTGAPSMEVALYEEVV